jgi:hypothetical protein
MREFFRTQCRILNPSRSRLLPVQVAPGRAFDGEESEDDKHFEELLEREALLAEDRTKCPSAQLL